MQPDYIVINEVILWVLGGVGSIVTTVFGYWINKIMTDIKSLAKNAEDERVSVAEIKRDVSHIVNEMGDTRKIALENLNRITSTEKDLIMLKGEVRLLAQKFQS